VKENIMSKQNPTAADPTNAAEHVTTEDAKRQSDAAAAAAVAAERKRVSEIQAAVDKAKLPAAFAKALVDEGVSIADAHARIIDEFAKEDQPTADRPQVNAGGARVVNDQVDRFRKGATLALLARGNLGGGERNEFTGMSLRELARSSLEIRGINVAGKAAREIVGGAFVPVNIGGMHSTSDFGSILLDVSNKAMLKGYDETDETFESWVSTGSAPDFKPLNRIDLNLFPALAKKEEGAEYNFGTIGDRKEVVQIATFGRKFAITREAIINDDMDAFTKVPMRMGRAAKRTIGDLVYAS
jgi:hypothetical protein